MITRRQFLKQGAAASLITGLGGCSRSRLWDRESYRKTTLSRVAIVSAASYEKPLADLVSQGLKLFALDVRRKRVLLKPNLVEFDPNGVINTHPALVEAAITAFRRSGAREVIVAEGPGHRRDNEYLLRASGLYDVIKEHAIRYVDLNADDVQLTKLRSHFTRLNALYFPKTLLDIDLVVSMAKLKTHHWAGVTLSLKNMFGVVPGSIYGWPKNALHWAGIDGSILDINSSLPVPQFAIVDGVIGMEGNGPIQGHAKKTGVLIFGKDLVAVDATAARVMKIEPDKIKYLKLASVFLGNTAREEIEQIGEQVETVQQDFSVIEEFRHLKSITG